jgi:hypothetical protein
LDDRARLLQKNFRLFLNRLDIHRRKVRNRAAYRIQTWWRTLQRTWSIVERNISRNEQFVADASAIADLHRENALLDESLTVVQVIATPQDLARAFFLIYNRVELVLILPVLPPGHIWEDVMAFFAHGGIPDVNERIHFILLRTLNSGESLSHRLECDMKSVKHIKKLSRGRSAFIVPHHDWFSEHRLSVDLEIPILGVVDTTLFQSRGQIKSIFTEAQVVTLLSTGEFRDSVQLCSDAVELLKSHPEALRIVIRYGFSQDEASLAYFDRTRELMESDIIKKEIHTAGCTRAAFFKMVDAVGGMAELLPSNILCFPSVSLFLSGDRKIEVIGTFDRLHHAPCRFAGVIVPESCVDSRQLLGHAMRVGSVLLKKGVIGFVSVDFVLYVDKGDLMLAGFDIRVNAYPASLFSVYMASCCGFDRETGKLTLLKNVGDPLGKVSRTAVIMNCISHPGMGFFSTREIRKRYHDEGLMFDLLNRTGFKMLFFDAPAKGANFALSVAPDADTAVLYMERALTLFLRTFGPKVGGDGSCTLTKGAEALRKFRERVGW